MASVSITVVTAMPVGGGRITVGVAGAMAGAMARGRVGARNGAMAGEIAGAMAGAMVGAMLVDIGMFRSDEGGRMIKEPPLKTSV